MCGRWALYKHVILFLAMGPMLMNQQHILSKLFVNKNTHFLKDYVLMINEHFMTRGS